MAGTVGVETWAHFGETVENKREMFDGMRAYHASEISHADRAITVLGAVAGAAGTVIVATLFPQTPLHHLSEIAWGLWLTVTLLAFTIAFTTHRKIDADHKRYATFGGEYVKTCQLLGFYDNVLIENETTSIKTEKEIGTGQGYRKTQRIIWSFAGAVVVLVLLFAVFSYRLG